MADLKIASWNIFFSFEIYRIRRGALEIDPKKSRYTKQTKTIRQTRETNIVRIINDLKADILGIVECMPTGELELFQKKFFPKHRSLAEGKGSMFYIGMLYDPARAKVEKLSYPAGSWKTRIGSDRSDKKYDWLRKPLIVKVTPKGQRRGFLLAVVHSKSKRRGRDEPASKDFTNRKQIVAEGIRIREIMEELGKQRANAAFREYVIMGDINDGPGFDSTERRLNVSGLETHLGSVLEPDRILYSFNDLSKGGERTTSFKTGQQIDHILMTRVIHAGESYPKMVPGSDSVRSDLVDISKDGKRRDSDHTPIEVKLKV